MICIISSEEILNFVKLYIECLEPDVLCGDIIIICCSSFMCLLVKQTNFSYYQLKKPQRKEISRNSLSKGLILQEN